MNFVTEIHWGFQFLALFTIFAFASIAILIHRYQSSTALERDTPAVVVGGLLLGAVISGIILACCYFPAVFGTAVVVVAFISIWISGLVLIARRRLKELKKAEEDELCRLKEPKNRPDAP